ncbi:MAG: tandem-95 repeat protein, partial [Bacteroidales bacterium]|nr:tandem-95 repeat protein [Bacteroidales bacterium]
MSPNSTTRRFARQESPARNQFKFRLSLLMLEDRTTPDASYWNLANGGLIQDWTNTNQITTDDDWSGVPSIMGFRGDNLTKFTGANPQLILTEGTPVIDANANQNNPDTYTIGGVTEFELDNPTIALAGSATADAPNIVMYLNTTGMAKIVLSYSVRDIDASALIASQPVALQYRIGDTGNFTDIPEGYISDATAGPNLTMTTPISLTLPAILENQAKVQIRIITANAAGNDEWVGIDDIHISGTPSISTSVSISASNAILNEGDSGITPFTFTVNRTGDLSGTTMVDYAVSGSGSYPANAVDFGGTFPVGNITFLPGESSKDIAIHVAGDTLLEFDEEFTVTLSNPTGAAIATAIANGKIQNDDTTPILINEVDADTPGSDTAEFVELYDGGIGNTNLDNLVVVFFDGTNNQSYAAFDLDGYSTNAQGFFVLGNKAVTQATRIFDDDLLKNSIGAVAIYRGHASDFPTSTPVTSTNLIDAVVYDSDNNDNTALLVALTPSQPQINENAHAKADTDAIARVPDGGFAKNTSTYLAQTPTPGARNIPPNTPPIVNITAGTLSYTEGDLPIYPALPIDNSISITDDGMHITSAIAYISSGYRLGQDTLAATSQGNVSIMPFDPVSGKLALAGTATIAEYENVLRSITFATGDDPGDGNRSVTIVVTDSDGVDSLPKSRMIHVSSVNDLITISAPSTFTVDEDRTIAISGITATDPDSGGNPVSLSLSSTHGIISITDTNFITVGASNTSQFTLEGSLSKIITSISSLTYIPDANYSGNAIISLTANDNGNTGGGLPTIDSTTIAITITPINDPPSFLPGGDVTVIEDAGPITIPAWATALTPGPNEAGQTLEFQVTNNQPSLFAQAPRITSDGTLTFTPANDAYGSATVTVTLMDDAGDNSSSTTYTFTITITPINDPPSFLPGGDVTVIEDAGPITIPAWATALTPGPNEAGQTLEFQVTNNQPSLFAQAPRITSDGTLTFTPANDAYGSATVTVTLMDDAGDNSSSTTYTFTITITPINDPPSFLPGGDVTVIEDAGPITIPAWATALTPGPNEAGQTLEFQVTNNQPSLFAQAPRITSDGTLTFTPANDAYGSATVTVTLIDDDGGGNSSSETYTFTITITPINDPPSFAIGPDLSLFEDSGMVVFPHWATNIMPGPSNESAQSVMFVISASDPSLFTGLTITPSGDLYVTPAADAFGSATLSVQIQDRGGSDFGGMNISNFQFAVITIIPVNDAPTFTFTNPSITSIYSAMPQSVIGFASNITPGPQNESGQSLSFIVSQISGDLTFSSPPDITVDGTLIYTTIGYGTATLQATLQDDHGVDHGGINAVTKSFTLTVQPPPIAPMGMDDSYTTPYNTKINRHDIGLLQNDSDPDSSVIFVTHVSPLSPATAGTLDVTAEGSFTFTPTRGFSGRATFSYQPTDGVLLGNITYVSIIVGDKPPPISQNDVAYFAVGAGSGGNGTVTLFDRNGVPGLTLTPFPGTSSAVRVAVANANGDTIPDLFVATGPGSPVRVLMIDGAGGRSQRAFTPFEDSFTGGAFLAAADLDGDGVADLAVSPDVSGGPRVIVYSGRTGLKLADFFGIDDPMFRGGTRLAFGDINGDGTPDLIVAAGMGGGPRVAVWDGVSVQHGQPRRLFNDIFVFEDTIRNGVYVASGDINGDGYDEILIGGGPNGGPRLIGLAGWALWDTQGQG